jgi:MSHA pilin protein MshD
MYGSRRKSAHPVQGPRPTRRDRGVTLVELVMFIVIVSAAAAGILMIISVTTQRSADPLLRKQALDVAESLMDEVFMHPMTYCDPDDANLLTATASTCATASQASGPQAGESRYSSTTPFDNVIDYNGFSMTGIRDLTNTPISGLSAYNATVSMTPVGSSYALSNDEALNITVKVITGNVTVSLSAVRFRHSPNYAP